MKILNVLRKLIYHAAGRDARIHPERMLPLQQLIDRAVNRAWMHWHEQGVGYGIGQLFPHCWVKGSYLRMKNKITRTQFESNFVNFLEFRPSLVQGGGYSGLAVGTS